MPDSIEEFRDDDTAFRELDGQQFRRIRCQHTATDADQ